MEVVKIREENQEDNLNSKGEKKIGEWKNILKIIFLLVEYALQEKNSSSFPIILYYLIHTVLM